MTSRLISILSLALLFVLPAQLNAFITQNTGCHHNGTWYADKSLVPTMEKCLNCQCNKKTLVCRLKVCPEMPLPPPRGCVVVQKKNTCCPYLSCARLDAFYKIPTKRRIIAYLDHYERESIDRVVNDNMLQRRSDDTEVDLFVCVKNGTVYKSGSAMSSSNLCSYCYCIGGTEKCVKPKCMLPVDGCKPIFVDSTCCPVRYDCSQKTSGKSSQEVRFRKTSNKHFLRMSQRPQRNRGCTVGKQYYAEGQKMKSDVDKPCDICFCIRGARRCAPKKCSPALKNCIPVVPKGQCCPSSYDCGTQRDYRRAQNSRQFNLFSLFFGKDEAGGGSQNSTALAERYPLDRHPTKAPTIGDALQASSEKSIFDTLREGLEFIDSNNNQMIADNLDLLALQTTEPNKLAKATGTTTATTATTTTTILAVSGKEEPSATTGISFLDMLLGPTEHVADGANSVEDDESTEKTTTPYKGLSWVDLLLGPDEEDEAIALNATQTDSVKPFEVTTEPSHTAINPNIERIADDFDDYLGSDEIAVGELPAEAQQIILSQNAYGGVKDNVALFAHSDRPTSTTTTTTTTTKKPSPAPTVRQPVAQRPTTQTNVGKPTMQENLLSAFLDGISNILDSTDNSTTTTTTTSSTTTTTTTTKPTKKPSNRPPPMFKPLPSIKTHTRINSKIANLTASPPIVTTKSGQNVTFKPLPNVPIRMPIAPSSTTTIRSTTTTTTTKKPLTSTARPNTSTTTTTTPMPSTTTVKPTTATAPTQIPTKTTEAVYITSTTTMTPVVIKTNPTILETEPLDAEPTLPPSLPNLKIIPFLPADAVNTELKAQQQQQPQQQQATQQFYEFYNAGNPATSKIDYGVYDEVSLYPAITSTFPYYNEPTRTQHDKAEYKYKFKIEGPETVPVLPPSVPTTAAAAAVPGSFEGSADYVKYEFGLDGTQPSKGFSPPTKTEGGFLPKEPLMLDDVNNVNDDYHVTQHIIDITTSLPSLLNTTRVIDLTTPDPFKDVIRTEPPPDLTTLIEDKQKQNVGAANKRNNTFALVATQSNANNVMQKLSTATRIDKTEIEQINKLDTLLDALLGAVGKPTISTTTIVPPFRTLPTTTSTTAKTATTPTTTTTTAATLTTKIASNEAHLRRSTDKPKLTRTTLKSATRAKNGTSTAMHATTATTTTTTTTTSTASIATKVSRTKSKPKPHQHRNTTSTTTKRVAGNGGVGGVGGVGGMAGGATMKPNKIKLQATRLRNTTLTTTTTTVRPTITPTTKAVHKSSNTIMPTTTTITTTTTTTTTPPSSTTTTTKATTSSSTTMHPFLMSPFDKLPFMDTSYEVKPNMMQPQTPHQQQQQHHPELFDVLQYKQTLNQYEGLEPNADSGYASTIRTSTVQSTSSASSTSSSTAANLIDSSGMLKLAGCNIYGRMYRVGRIILELSSPCLECKCTEVGVKCGPLDC